MPDSPLFRNGYFTLASGLEAKWKIECDALVEEDWATLAMMAVEGFGNPSSVVGVPRGGLPFAKALAPHCQAEGPQWIVDDVFTTGRSIKMLRTVKQTGVVVFARTPPPHWIKALFTMYQDPPLPKTTKKKTRN